MWSNLLYSHRELNIATEIIQSREQKGKLFFKKYKPFWVTFWTNQGVLRVTEVPGGKKKKWCRKFIWKNNGWNFLKLGKHQLTDSRISEKPSSNRQTKLTNQPTNQRLPQLTSWISIEHYETFRAAGGWKHRSVYVQHIQMEEKYYGFIN